MVRQFENSQNVAKALIRSMSAGQYSPKTLAHVQEHTRIVINHYLGDRSLYDITAEDVRQIARGMADDGLAIATQKNYIHALRQLLRFIHNPARPPLFSRPTLGPALTG